MLKLDQVDVYYGDLQALWQISLFIDDGEIVTLIGSNGAGKSTMLRSISGLLKPKRGKITYGGIEINALLPHKVVEQGISMVPEGRGLFPEMSVLEHLELGAFITQARRNRDKTIAWIYEIFPVLKLRVRQLAGTLSGGEQQMLAIARALMSQPRLLLLDEMSIGLAPVLVQTIGQVIGSINTSRKTTFFLVEQNVRIALKLANRGYIMENGRIVGQGDAELLLDDVQIKNAYLGADISFGGSE